MQETPRTIITRIVIAACCSALGGGIVLAFGLQPKVAAMIGLVRDNLTLVALVGGGLGGLLGLVLALAFELDQKLLGLISPAPELGSLVFRATNLQVTILPDDMIVAEHRVQLANQNNRMIRYDAVMTGNANSLEFLHGQTGENRLVFSGIIPANGEAILILRMQAVSAPALPDGSRRVDWTLRYDVRYRFDGGGRLRRTAKTMTDVFFARANAPPAVGATMFSEEVEE